MNDAFVQICLSNAKLELEVNCSPQVALKVLTMVQKCYPTCFKEPLFIQAITRVLVTLGDLKQLRWIFQTALADSVLENGAVGTAGAGAGGRLPGLSKYHGGGSSSSSRSARSAYATNLSTPAVQAQLKEELVLWEEYLQAETVLGQSDVVRLNSLRARRDRVRAVFEESERIRLGIVYTSKEEARAAQRGVFAAAQDLVERYNPTAALVLGVSGGTAAAAVAAAAAESRAGGASAASSSSSAGAKFVAGGANGAAGSSAETILSLSEADWALQERCVGPAGVGAAMGMGAVIGKRKSIFDRSDALGGMHAGGAGGGGAGGKRGGSDSKDMLNMSTEFHLSMAGLPAIIRDLLAKLPLHSGPPPDVDGFVRHVKGVIMPPRPSPEDELDLLAASSAAARRRAEGSYGSGDEDGGDGAGAGAGGTGEGGGEGVSGAASAWLGAYARGEAADLEDGAAVAGTALGGSGGGFGGGGGGGGGGAAGEDSEDVFRKRKKARASAR
jgi:hypothetical protein